MMNHPDIPASLTILEAIRWAASQLESCHIESPRLNAELLLGHILKLSRLELYLKFDRPLTLEERHAFVQVLEQRMEGLPVQYITGIAEFFSLPFRVTPAVLIPRPETEILVERAILFLKPPDQAQNSQLDLFQTAPMAFDLGTGSGIIAATLAHSLPDLTVYASDISPEALEVARCNARHLGVSDRIRFFEGAYFEPLTGQKLEGAFDLIVSNPPYIPENAFERLPDEVRKFEPRAALDGGADGLTCYQRIIEGAPAYLRPGGMLMMEIGTDQAGRIVDMLEDGQAFQAVQVIQDYNQRDRVVTAERSG